MDIGVWGFTIFWLFPVSLLVGLVSIQNISLFWPQLVCLLPYPTPHTYSRFTVETIPRQTPLAIRSHPILHPNPPRSPPRHPHTPNPPPHSQKGTHDHNPLSFTRSHHDALLQVPHRQHSRLLLRRNRRASVGSAQSICTSRYHYRSIGDRRYQFPFRRPVLRRMEYVCACCWNI